MRYDTVKEHHLYDKTFRRGTRFVGKLTAVYVLRDYAAKRLMLANPEKKYFNRVGLSVGKKIGGAVQRNRAKRLLREGYRVIFAEGQLAKGYLIILAAREGIKGKKSPAVEAELRRAFRQLGLLHTA